MDRLMEELRAHFDLIVLDCAPVLAIAETRAIARHADVSIVIARWAKTPIKAVCAAVHELELNGGQVGGVVINDVDIDDMRRAGYFRPYAYPYPTARAA